MEIGGCRFPDDAFFEPEGMAWARKSPNGRLVMGATSILVGLTGRIASLRPKPVDERYPQGRVLAMVESARYVGAIRAPVDGVLLRANPRALESPRLVSDDPYESGWVLELRPDEPLGSTNSFLDPVAAKGRLATQIAALRVRCFAAVPDFEMVEIGTECSAVLAHLDELLDKSQPGEVVHVVSDDPTAPIEMVRWQRETGHALLETRREGNLYHFIVRKVAHGPGNVRSPTPP